MKSAIYGSAREGDAAQAGGIAVAIERQANGKPQARQAQALRH